MCAKTHGSGNQSTYVADTSPSLVTTGLKMGIICGLYILLILKKKTKQNTLTWLTITEEERDECEMWFRLPSMFPPWIK